MKEYYLSIAARNLGWDVEIIQNGGGYYLYKYSKGNKFFYSTRFTSIDINSQNVNVSGNKVITERILSREV